MISLSVRLFIRLYGVRENISVSIVDNHASNCVVVVVEEVVVVVTLVLEVLEVEELV